MVPKKGPKKDGKTRIIEGAIECFVKSGVAQTTLKQIAKTAGVDQPLIHYYFGSLDELYGEVVQSVRESLGAASVAILEGETSPLLQVKKYIEGTLRWGQRHPGLHSIWVYFYYMATYQPTFAELNVSIRQVGRDRMELFIHRGVEQGVFKLLPGFNVPDAAYCIHTFLTGALVVGGSGGGKKKSKAEEWDQAVALTIEGAMRWLGVRES